MTVSIITPVYNSLPFIFETINSVVNQTYTDWEMIIVDDFSSDDTFRRVQAYTENETRIKIFKLTKNSGAAVARNYAISRAEGEFIAFIDADDLWLPNKLEKQINYMKYNNYILTHTNYEIINESGDKIGKMIAPNSKLSYNDMLKTNQIGCLTAIYDTKKIGKIYLPDIRKRQDYALWLKILKRIDYAYCLPECLSLYRVRSNSISRNKFKILKYNWLLFYKIENFSVLKSLYFFGWNIINKILRYSRY